MSLKVCYPSGAHSGEHPHPPGAVGNAESQAPPSHAKAEPPRLTRLPGGSHTHESPALTALSLGREAGL